MALNDRLVAFAQAVGVDIGELIITRGNLTALNTVAKNNLVAAINEIKAGIASIDLTALINDAATTGDLTSVYSADKLVALFDQLKNEILNGAPDSFNTLKEISDYLVTNDQNINNLLDLISKTVRYDAPQTLLSSEQLQACVNINVGNPEIDLVAFLNPVNPIALGGNYELLAGPKESTIIHITADNSPLTIDMVNVQGVSPASIPASVGYLGVAVNITSLTDLQITPVYAGADIFVTDITIMSGPAGTQIGTIADAFANNTALVSGDTYNLYFNYSNQDRTAKITFSVAGTTYTVEFFILGQ